MGSEPPLGCWILVYPRTDSPPTNAVIEEPSVVEKDPTPSSIDIYRNHYVAKRLVTTKDYPRGSNWVSRRFDEIGEWSFFVGVLTKTMQALRDRYDPSCHAIRIIPAKDHRFPEKMFRLRGLKNHLANYSSAALIIPVIPLQVFWDTPQDFVLTIGLTSAVVLFIFYVFKLVTKKF